MLTDNDKISYRQMTILLVLNFFSAASLTLPRVVAEYADQDGWLIVIGATAISVIYGLIVTQLGQMFPNETFIEYSDKIIFKYTGKVLGVIFTIKLIIFCAFELRIFGELVKQTLLSKTPLEVIMITMLLTAAYLSRKGYECRARIGEFLIFFIFIPVFAILFFAMGQMEATNLAPFFVAKPRKIFEGIYYVSLIYIGIELMLLAIPFMRNPQKAGKAVMRSIILVGVINLIVVFITIGTFGVTETKNHIWPVMSMMQMIDIPIVYIERQDALMMVFWIMTVFAIINAFIFFASLTMQRVINVKEQNFLVLPLLPIIYYLALIPNNIVHAYELIEPFYVYGGILFLLIIPLILLGIAKLRKLGDENNEDNQTS